MAHKRHFMFMMWVNTKDSEAHFVKILWHEALPQVKTPWKETLLLS